MKLCLKVSILDLSVKIIRISRLWPDIPDPLRYQILQVHRGFFVDNFNKVLQFSPLSPISQARPVKFIQNKIVSRSLACFCNRPANAQLKLLKSKYTEP